ncbi:phenylacetate--CoA ligase family protein [Catalinimonas niigatensis]|uniref:phenylacetate--CoA ligase family protein n=1 Tax=Catalinimonas niigatensis TaxID=1397264 RepID=UPI0026654DEF|nr:AMP-binding protein [Catalinimonas niigatensis]WPP48778.1 AMP-binding protein [Catalinimonas niigatensis]
MITIPEIEKASKDEIASFQLRALQEMLHYLLANSTFYQDHFVRHQISIDEIQSLSDLTKIPPIGKKELQQHNQQFYCVPKSKIIDYSNTSGTEGEAVTVPLSEKDMERLAYNEAISLACAGGNENEIYQLTTTVDRRFMAGLAYVLGARKLGAGMIRVGPGIPELHWKTIQEVEPTALIVVPSFLLKLIEFAETHNIDFRHSSIKKAVCIGEPIRRDDFSLNALGERIRAKWDIDLYSTYASTEMGTAFTECEAGQGGHFHPELIITELLDENEQPVQQGAAGELTITTLGVEAMPLLRFKTGDICRKLEEPCICGRNTYRLGPVIGRKNQMIKYKGTTLYPASLSEVMNSSSDIMDYVIEVSSNEFDNDEILIRYAAKESLNVKELIDHFKSSIRVTPQLIPVKQEELQKLAFPKMSRKPVKFIDRRIF